MRKAWQKRYLRDDWAKAIDGLMMDMRTDPMPDGSFANAEMRQKRRRLLWIAAAAIAVLALAAILINRSHRRSVEVASAQAQAGALPHVTVIKPGRSAVSAVVTATGSLAARREMPVGIAGEGGMVASVNVDAGQFVRAGQVLAAIDRAVQVQQVNQLSASVRAADADAAVAQSELNRAQALVARGFISRADIERKTATRDSAQARVAVAKAQLGEQRARLGRLDVRAPAAGLVLTRAVEPGQVVSSASPPLFRIAKDGMVELRAAVAEQELAALHVGQPAKVTPVGSTQSFTGSIWLVAPIVDPQTRQGEVRIALNFDRALRPGGFARAEITSGSADQPLLPESAVQTGEKGSYVLIVDRNGVVQRREIELGSTSSRGLAVTGGLDGTEQVVLSAGAFLTPGDKVKPELAAAR